MPEKTSKQLVKASIGWDGTLQYEQSYSAIRNAREDPTISLARQLSLAPLLMAKWSYESDEEDADEKIAFIRSQMDALRPDLLRTALFGCCDFGWQPYEKIFGIDEENSHIILKKLKPLLHDITKIIVDPKSGAFIGLKNGADSIDSVLLSLSESLVLNWDVEGTNWYGHGVGVNALKVQGKWETVESAANRFDKKVAGAQWVVQYPPGSSEIEGRAVDNFDLASKLLTSLEASGGIVMPRQAADEVDSLDADTPQSWSIELKGFTGSTKGSFIERQRYLDALKVRAYGLPERAVLQGEFGTKADAEAHADFAIVNMELRHELMVQQVNKHVVNQLLVLNFGHGSKGAVRIVPTPITDATLQLLRKMYVAILSNPTGFLQELDNLDMAALRDKLAIPSVNEDRRQEPL